MPQTNPQGTGNNAWLLDSMAWPFGKKKAAGIKGIKPKEMPAIKPDTGAKEHEVTVFRAEVTAAKKLGMKGAGKKPVRDVLPLRVHNFDKLIVDGGVERGATMLISGGAGTGKTTFALQSLYEGAKKGERGIFLSFEEEPDKIIKHMKKNYNWNLEELQKKGLLAIIKFDPTRVARSVEGAVAAKTGTLRIKFKQLELPFIPDRIAIDSLSALSIAFETEENYRKYIRQLFETMEEYNAVSLVITETEQDPRVYSRTGVEEFLADGVLVLYNIKKDGERHNALEILKMRSSRHEKKMIRYRITSEGIVLEHT